MKMPDSIQYKIRYLLQARFNGRCSAVPSSKVSVCYTIYTYIIHKRIHRYRPPSSDSKKCRIFTVLTEVRYYVVFVSTYIVIFITFADLELRAKIIR